MKKHCRWFSEDSGRCLHKKNSSNSFPGWCGYKVNHNWEMHVREIIECDLYSEINEHKHVDSVDKKMRQLWKEEFGEEWKESSSC
jgi:hypothetical protein